MLQLWLGRAHSGKSQRIFETIRRLGTESRQILLVPQYATHETEIDLFRTCGASACRHAEVLSFESLSERVLNLMGGNAATELDGGGKLLIMQKTLEELASELRFFRRSFSHSALLKNLVSLADELENYCVAPEQLLGVSEQLEGSSRDKMRDLALISSVYEGKLRESGVDRRSRVMRMAECIGASGYVRDKDIFIDGISFFNGCEERVIAVMLGESRSVTVSLLADTEDDSEIFQETTETLHRLERLAKDNGVPCETTVFTGNGSETPLSYMEGGFFGNAPAFSGSCGDAVHLLCAQDSYAEAESAAAEIRRLAAREGYRYRDIEIMVRDTEQYRVLLRPILQRYEIPFFLSERRPITDAPLCTMLLSLLESVSGGYAYEDMFRWLKTGLSPLTREECDRLENYCLRWRVRGSMWTREEPFAMHPDGYGAVWTEAGYAALEEINALRERVRRPLLQLADGLRGDTVHDMLRAVYEVLVFLEIPTKVEQHAARLQERGEIQAAEEYSQLWNTLIHVIDEFDEIMGKSRMDAEPFIRLFRLLLDEYCIGSIPVALDQVKISPMTQNDRHTVRALFLLGANEGVIPADSRSIGLITEEEREALDAEGLRLAPGEKRRFAMELQNIYAALAQPRERLYVSYPAADAAGNELQPSFLVSRLQTLFPDLPFTYSTTARFTAAPKSALPLAAGEGGEELRAYFRASGDNDSVLQAMDRAAQVQRGRLSPGAVALLYGQRFRMSASRMDRLRQCHYAYFLQYGLKAKERKASGLDALETGTFLHYILEHVSRDAELAGGFAAVSDRELSALCRKYAEIYKKENLYEGKQQNARFRYLFRRLSKSAEEVVLNLAAELRCSDFKPLAFELAFGTGDESRLPAITVEEGKNTLQVNGKVDRVDGWKKDGKLYLRVVDYKSGKKTFDLADVRYGLNLQMLLYLFTLEREGESLFGAPIVPAGVLYMPARQEILSMDRNAEETDIKNEMDKHLRRSGLLLNDAEVLEAMEHGAGEGKATFLPLSSRSLRSVASAEQIGILARHVDRQMHEITREMAEGTIDADPCCRSENDTACAYCEFRSACHFENGRGGDHLRYIRPVADLTEYWQKLSETAEGGTQA